MVQRQTGKLRRKHKDLAHLGRKTNKEQMKLIKQSQRQGRQKDRKSKAKRKNYKTTKIKQGITLVKNPKP